MLIQILLVLIKHKSTKKTLNHLIFLIRFGSNYQIEMKNKRRIILFSKISMKLIVILRCVFIYTMKKSSLTQILPYICTISEIELENFVANMLYITASCLKTINKQLESYNEDNRKLTKNNLIELQKFHNFICDYSKYIQTAFGATIGISVFSILSQLLLIAYFEITLNIRPIKRNWKMDLYLTVNIVYSVLNIVRVGIVCFSSQTIEHEVFLFNTFYVYLIDYLITFALV